MYDEGVKQYERPDQSPNANIRLLERLKRSATNATLLIWLMHEKPSSAYPALLL